ncbi:unnamed protein product [Ceutorhynchus assimilis]|uniref:Receptor ligand binding region domain-containing protein n=1 Tax=Ceutorhynchus assimilis TaxID=467358 RepID=A0A9N9MH85_9CUCU|nr:unnamed protein product [Ceutorhynchus assimilis]
MSKINKSQKRTNRGDFASVWYPSLSLETRIIIGSFSTSIAPFIFCAAYDLGMFGSEYVWILETPRKIWWQNLKCDCDSENLQKAIEGVIVVGDYEFTYYDEYLLNKMKTLSLESRYAKHTYDAIWTMALTLRTNNMNSLQHFNYGRKDMTCAFYDTMRRLKFLGLSGPIKFDGADRVGDLVVSQIQGRSYQIF